MMDMWRGVGWRVTAAKKFRGGSACATSASSSDIVIAALARSTSPRLCSTISRSVAGIIAGIVLTLAPGFPFSAPAFGAPARQDEQVPIDPTAGETRASTPDAGATGTGSRALIEIPEIPIDEIRNASLDDAARFAARNRAAVMLTLAGVILVLLWMNGTLRAGGFKKAGLRKVDAHPAFLWLFAAMVVYLAWQTGAQLIAGMKWVQDGPAGQTLQRQGVMNLVGYAVGITAGLGMLHLLARSGPESGVRFRAGDVGIGLWAFALAWPVVEAASFAAVFIQQYVEGQSPGLAHPTLAQIVDSPNDPWRWVVIASVVLGAPIVEELIYRVFIQSSIIRVVGGVWPGVLITAGIFAAVHRLGGDNAVPWVALAPIFVLGLAMGIAYERTKRVGVPIMMHVAFNALNVGLAMMSHSPAGAPVASV